VIPEQPLSKERKNRKDYKTVTRLAYLSIRKKVKAAKPRKGQYGLFCLEVFN
jgi:hypothetical protein